MPRVTRSIFVLAFLLSSVVGPAIATVSPARAATGVVTLYGHGWGHGRGLGQFGAQGYASLYGWSSAQILDRFYNPTVAGAASTAQSVSVWLTRHDGVDLEVTSNAPFEVAGYGQAGGRAVRITNVNGTIYGTGESGCGGAQDGWVPLSSPVVVTSSVSNPGNDLSQMLTICGDRTYRGQLSFLLDSGVSRTVSTVAIEDYLRGVVPRESPAWFAPAALEAQAVGARSYVLGEGGENGQRFAFAKTCDSTTCQVYGGAGSGGTLLEHPATNAAVAATAGLVRRYPDGALGRTEYSSSSGGWTVQGNFTGVQDDGDAVPSNPFHDWTAAIPISSLESAYGLGSFVGLNIISRNGLGDWGGRVTQMQVVGTARSVTLTGARFQSDWGLRSPWFNTSPSNTALIGPSIVSRHDGTVAMAMMNRNAGVSYRTGSGGSYGAWQSLDGIVTSDPELVSWGAGRVDLFVRGADAALWHRGWTTASGWLPWERLGGVLTSGPAATSTSFGRVDVYMAGTDGGLWTIAWTGSGWTSFSSLGGVLTSDPDAASSWPGRADVFARGTDGALWHLPILPEGTLSWRSVGGTLSSGPTAVAWSPNRLDLFARGGDGAMYGQYWDGSQWTGWLSYGGGLASAPDAASIAPDRIDVAARGTDGSLFQRSWNGATWSGWTLLGPSP